MYYWIHFNYSPSNNFRVPLLPYMIALIMCLFYVMFTLTCAAHCSVLRDFSVVRQSADARGDRRLRTEPDAYADRVHHGHVPYVCQHVHGLLHSVRQDQSHVGRKGTFTPYVVVGKSSPVSTFVS